MAYPSFTAGSVTTQARVYLNDTIASQFTDAVLIPFLNGALKELQEIFELNEVPVVDTFTSTPIPVNAGTTSIPFQTPDPHLPVDLVEPQIVWQSQRGQNEYIMVDKVDYLPRYFEGQQINYILSYVWQAQQIKFLPSNADLDIKIDYIRFLFGQVTSAADNLSVINTESFLAYRTAALAASFSGENTTRAEELNNYAIMALDRVTGIAAKGRQGILIRRRPFRAAYKRRTFM